MEVKTPRRGVFERIGKRASVFKSIDFPRNDEVRVCRFWVQGRCNRNPCKFLHSNSNTDAMIPYDIRPTGKPETGQGPMRKPESGPTRKHSDLDDLKPEDIVDAKRFHINKVAEAPTEVAEPLTVKLPTEVAEPLSEVVKPVAEVAKPPAAEMLKPPTAEAAKPPAAEVAKPADVANTEVMQSAEVANTEVANTAELSKPPTEVVKPVEVSKPPTEVAKPAEVSKPAEVMKPVEVANTEVAKLAEVSKPPTEAAKPAEVSMPPTDVVKPPAEGPLSNLDEGIVPKEHKLPNSDEGDNRCKDLHCTGSGISLLNKQLKRHNAAVTGVCLPSGIDKLYSVSKDGTLCVWDGKSGECVESLQLESEIGCLVSEGPWLFVGLENRVNAWNLNTSTLVVLDGPHAHVRSIAAGDGDKIICGLEDGSIMVWKFTQVTNHPALVTPALVATLKGHQLSVSSLCIVDGCLYSASEDKSIRVWDLKTFECRYVLNAHFGAVTSIFFWGRTYMLSGSLDNTLKVWAQSEDGIWRVVHEVGTDSGVVGLSCIGDAATSTTLLCSLNDNSVRLYSLPSFTERARISSGAAITTLVGGSSNLFFTGDSTGQLDVWLCEGAQQL